MAVEPRVRIFGWYEERPPNESTESRNPGTLEHVDTEGDLVNSFGPALKVLRSSLHPQLIPIHILRV